MKRKTPYNLTQSELKEEVSYDPLTGVMAKLHPRTGVRLKTSEEKKSIYFTIRIRGRCYKLHRLAFLYMTGEIPQEVDHKDLNTRNNRWSNLRPATRAQNKANCHAYKNNTSGYKGVIWDARAGCWRARIRKNGHWYQIGQFDDVVKAGKAYLRKAKRLYKEFARA